MRWIALWFLLTCAYLGGLGLSWWATGEAPTKITLLHLLVVPPAQLLALWVVILVRRASNQASPESPSDEGEAFDDGGL